MKAAGSRLMSEFFAALLPPEIMIAERIIRLLYPKVCPVCGDILTEKNLYEKNPHICRRCYGDLSFTEGSRCLRCANPVDDETKELCRECERRERFFDTGMALLDHTREAKNIIYGFKFRYMLDNLEFPALEIAKRHGERILNMGTEAFIPVPLHSSRKRERGYNQAELLAKAIERYMRELYGKAPVTDSSYLIRKEKTKHQMSLDPSKREGNVKKAFAVNPGSGKQYRNVCVVDDIYTTGSTINACAKTLKDSGCRWVSFVSVSR